MAAGDRFNSTAPGGGVVVIDTTNRDRPVAIGTEDLLQPAISVAGHGDHVWVLEQRDGNNSVLRRCQ